MPEAELTLTPMASAPMAEFDALDALDRAASRRSPMSSAPR